MIHDITNSMATTMIPSSHSILNSLNIDLKKFLKIKHYPYVLSCLEHSPEECRHYRLNFGSN